MSEEIIDGNSGGSGEVPQALKTLGILSIIGNALWGLLFLIGMFWILGNTAGLAGIMPGLGDALILVVVICVVIILLNILGLMGAMKMMKGNKGGFIMYTVVTSLWALLMLLAGVEGGIWYILSGIVSIGFIVAFSMQLKKL
ncbi:MAG: hypothetical protein GQ574_23415 [Crocinitomix sp.]|nr:hypothetical protein [Crocinitomix sp.]